MCEGDMQERNSDRATAHRPKRSCVACRQRRDKGDLLRIARTGESGFVVDSSGKMPGRGSYVCLNEKCIRGSLGRNLIQRSLKVRLSAESCARLREECLRELGAVPRAR
ncbi:MAG: DUF448 domain-containing protein [Armatimonadetes bacterium CG07_land_8_20_14_0_80_59_28]|nr:MAG: DUF448 domain-containing protein [Armatimonadetes bacterium CG07_land_8_20_14_0_80_59_28]